ncbi:Phosphoribosylaminoimidazole carboxylase, chloroplastic (Fragment) [Linum perenne]
MLQRLIPVSFDSLAATSDFCSLKPCFFPSRTSHSLSINKLLHHPSSSLSLQKQSQGFQNQAVVCRASSSDELAPVRGVSETVVGVLGGGQLGRMLCQSGSELGIKVIVLDPLVGCPASSIAHDHMVGSFDDSATVEDFAKRCGVLTVEIEHVDVATLERLEHQGVDCQPKASTIRTIQDKYLQKVHFARHGIPLPEFMQILLNEVAPRPHNSGHHTIEACYTSQYEQHLRAVLGLPLGDPSMKSPAAMMYNLLGEEEGDLGFHLAHQLIVKALTIPGANVPEMRKQRKMGHVTIVGPSMGIVEARMNLMLKEQGSAAPSTADAPRVGIIMGSDSDLPVMKDASRILTMFGIPHEVYLPRIVAYCFCSISILNFVLSNHLCYQLQQFINVTCRSG